jgi:hypothetical protein
LSEETKVSDLLLIHNTLPQAVFVLLAKPASRIDQANGFGG